MAEPLQNDAGQPAPFLSVAHLTVAQRQALVWLITGPATLIVGGWCAGTNVIADVTARVLAGDRLIDIRAGQTYRKGSIALTPKGRFYAAACMLATSRIPDVAGKMIRPAK